MMSGWLFALRRLARRVWVRAALFCLAAVATALAGIWFSPFIPSDVPTKIGSDAVDNILGIIAASMLTVTTFSLSTMVSAFSAATNSVTPRATTLVIEDPTSQNVLSTFVGAFLYSLVGIIILSTGAYGERGRVVLFVVTIVVVIVIVVTLLRWLEHLTRLGRVTDTRRRVEEATSASMRDRHAEPFLGGRPFPVPIGTAPSGTRPLFGATIGYVQHVDMEKLDAAARDAGSSVYVAALPGAFVGPGTPLAFVAAGASDDVAARLRGAFTLGDARSFDQDPRFGAIVLAEIASRALSPATNDPGTAIDVIGRMVRLVALWRDAPDADEPRCDAVFVPPLAVADLFEDMFVPIARDGAAVPEVMIRLQKALGALAGIERADIRAAALHHAREALARADAAIDFEADRRRVRAAAGAPSAPVPA